MIGPRKAFVLATLFLSAFSNPTPEHHDDDLSNWDKFSALLDTVDEGALHRVLHAVYPKFKDGVFSKDRTALEHVHSENPVMASKLVHIAKRQSNNGTVIATTPSQSSSSARGSTSSSAQASASPSTPQETSQSLASVSVQSSISSALTSQLSSQIYATTVPPPTTVLVAPSSPSSATPISTGSGVVVYSTRGGGVVTLTSSAVRVSFTPSTSTHLYYTTSADGSVGTRTSLIIVNAPVTETAAATGAAGAATTTGSAGLRNAAGKASSGGLTAFIIGALGFVAAL